MKSTGSICKWVVACCIAALGGWAACAAPPVAAPPVPPPKPLANAAAAAPKPPRLRLDPLIRPTHYAAELTVTPSGTVFAGQIDIDLNLGKSTALIWLNGSDLSIQEARLSIGDRSFPAQTVPGNDDFIGFAVDTPVGPGPATLHVRYQGKILFKENIGLFKESIGDDVYAFTQFEATDARRVFPCFDEPSFKVPWQLSLHVPKDQAAFSNTPIASQGDDPDDPAAAGQTDSQGGQGQGKGQGQGMMKTVRFEPTRPLPSYLIAFAVGPLVRVDAGQVGATPIGIIVPRNKAAQARYAVSTTPKLLSLLLDYFAIPFPYAKLDLVSVPQLGGAMENAGLITFSEALILATPREETLAFQQRFAATAAHEMAHQWFGDLVTMEFWNDVWLNESFASWMDEKIIATWQPRWDMRTEAIEDRSRTMAGDSLQSARRIRQPIETKDDIDNAFDGITYGKGEAVLDMFESWLTPQVFQQGVRHYLREHADGNATADDFVQALSAAAQRDVKGPFSTFLDQVGVPLVSVALRCPSGQPGSGEAALTLSQRRYLPLGSQAAAQKTWQVPLCVRTNQPIGRDARDANNAKQAGAPAGECTLLTTAAADFPLAPRKGCPDWVMGNAGAAGYYRVLYQGDLLERLLRGGARGLSPGERVSVLSDLSAFLRSGDLPAAQALGLVSPFAREPNRHVLMASLGLALSVYRIVPDELLPRYGKFIRGLFGERASSLGWKSRRGESDDARLLRPELVSAVAEYGEDAALSGEARRLALAWLADHGALDDDMVGPTLHAAARVGDRALFDAYRDAAQKTQERRDRVRVLSALGSFHDPALLAAALGLLLDGEFDMREALGLLYDAFGERQNRAAAYDFIKKNFAALVDRLPKDNAAYLPLAVGGAFCDESVRADAEQFFTGRSTKFTGGPRILTQALERISLCVALKTAQKDSLVEFLRKQ